MCGIAGLFNRNGLPINVAALARMTRSLVHRGPDEEGYMVNVENPGSSQVFHEDLPLRGSLPGGSGNVGLGHRRLSIIDLSTGQQPLANEDGTVWVVFNGEIYNFQELQVELGKSGHRFRTRSDTEVIVHAWEEWGEWAAERFRGMFAIALWDERRRTLWLVRDRLGKKPLYYSISREQIIFGSEIKAVLEGGDVDRSLDLTSLWDSLSLVYIPSPKTIFKGVRKLPPAHYAVITSDEFRVQRYWDLSFDPVHAYNEEKVIEDLLGMLEEATRLRMISEVPLGAFLSGGVDSSGIVAMMAGASNGRPVLTNSISFSEAAYDEAVYARRIADLFHTDHHEFQVKPEAVPVVEKLAWHYDEPFADSSAVPTYYVSKMARENVTVSLSGDGGDENFAGYRRYYIDLMEGKVRSALPRWVSRNVVGLLGRIYPKADYLPQVLRGKTFLSNVARDPAEAYFTSVSIMTEADKKRLVNPELLRNIGGYDSRDLFHRIYREAQSESHLSRLQYLDIRTYLCEDILTKVDRASMAVSLEVRCPILDHKFMEYVARIPPRMKLRGREGKSIFKKALAHRLPEDVLYRPKMGFSVPVAEWLRRELREYAHELIFEGSITRQMLNPDAVARMWNRHQAGLRNHSAELWTLMTLNLWYRMWGERAGSVTSQSAAIYK